MNRPALLLTVLALTAPVAIAVAAPASAATPTCAGFPATIVGTDGNDVIHGTSGKDVIVAKGGNDRVYGLGNRDAICGGPGSDKLFGGPAGDFLFGGIDALHRGGGHTTRIGDELTGGPGDDYLQPDADHRAAGRVVPDSILWNDSAHGVSVNVIARTATGDGNDLFTEKGAALIGSKHADTFIGGPGADMISGNKGGDVIYGNGGGDTLIGDAATKSASGDGDAITGGGGDDTIVTSFGRDIIGGGGGNDTITDVAGTPDKITGGPGNDTITTELARSPDSTPQTIDGSGGIDLLSLRANVVNPNHITSTGVWDMATGAITYTITSPIDVIAKGFEDASLRSKGAKWTIDGTNGDNALGAASTAATTFNGLDGNDAFRGSPGNDTFDGGPGTDEALTMGPGNDTCISVETIDVDDCEIVTP